MRAAEWFGIALFVNIVALVVIVAVDVKLRLRRLWHRHQPTRVEHTVNQMYVDMREDVEHAHCRATVESSARRRG